MKNELIELLRCPRTGQQLCLERAKDSDDAFLVSENGEHKYPIRNGIQVVPETNYADNFGEQWNHFRLTQLDSYAGHPISADRFWAATNWKPKDLKGKTIIDIGCGAGRFAEIALKAGTKVIAVDYSSAVEACYRILRMILTSWWCKGTYIRCLAQRLRRFCVLPWGDSTYTGC